MDQSAAWQALQTIPQTLTDISYRNSWHEVIKFSPSSSLSVLLKPSTRLIADKEDPYSVFPVPKVFTEDMITGLIIDEDPDIVLKEYNNYVLVPVEVDTTTWEAMGYTPYSYLVPHTGGLKPTILRSGSSYLFSGVDFYNTEYGLVFSEDPALLFSDGIIHVVHGVRPPSTSFPYTTGVDPTQTSGVLTNRYLRTTNSPTGLVAALNEVLGLDGFYKSSNILDSHRCSDDSVLYTTTEGVVRIRQPHAELRAGDTVAEGQVPGSVVQLFSYATHGHAWYSKVEVPSNGIPASHVLQFASPHDRIPPGPIAFTEVDGFCRFDIGSGSLSGDFFDYTRSRTDTLSGEASLSAWILSNQVDGQFDLLQFLFDYVWKYTGCIITYDEARTPDADIKRITDFLYRNQPINAVLFLIPSK